MLRLTSISWQRNQPKWRLPPLKSLIWSKWATAQLRQVELVESEPFTHMFEIDFCLCCIFGDCCICAEYCIDHEVDPILSRTSHGKLFSINEEEQREALKGFYERYSTNCFTLSSFYLLNEWKFESMSNQLTGVGASNAIVSNKDWIWVTKTGG